MSAVGAATRRTFRSLRVRNYRLYFIAQLISNSGTWMDRVAQAWLVLHLTGSGFDLGIVTGLQFLPVLLFGPWGGLVADRMDKRKLLYATQAGGGLIALALGILVETHTIQLWQVFLLAFCLGVMNLFDNPARQTFVFEMVGKEDLPNAVSLNSVVMNASRVVGPAVGGLVITLVGLGVCFLANAASFGAVLVGLALMRSRELHKVDPVVRAKGQLRDGFRYVWRTPSLRNTLIAMAVIGIFAYNFQVTLALLATVTFHGGAGSYAVLTSCMGIGAIVGGLTVAHRGRPTPRLLQGVALMFGALLAVVALSPSLAFAAVVIVFMGAASIAFIATANAELQLESEPAMRGRVMALYAMAFLGSTPIGGPLIGAIAEWTNPRVSLAVGAVATLLAAGILRWRYRAGEARTATTLAESATPLVEPVREVTTEVA
ncbi:MAG: MFS transporter [Acidimicrobiales bacterium]